MAAAPFDTIVFHDPCMDGASAAWVAYTALGRTPLLVPLKAGGAVDVAALAGRRVLAVDVVPTNHAELAAAAAALLVLDHHATNEAALRGVPYARFDMTRSGVGLAWAHFHGDDTPMPHWLACVEDRDLWRWAVEGSRDVSEGLYDMVQDERFVGPPSSGDTTRSQHPRADFRVFDALARMPDLARGLLSQGEQLNRRKERQLAALLRGGVRYRIRVGDATHTATLFNVAHDLASDLGNLAAKQHGDLAVMWRYDHRSERYWYSVRSTDAGPDASAVATAFGGGGHRNAAGFESALPPAVLFAYEQLAGGTP